ncbi:MAG: T9SS type A sorting domain-containing protein [Chitinophagales bacterium]|nr:T9SS type A sorting domain-containing protein [Chitinophagales bacterium]
MKRIFISIFIMIVFCFNNKNVVAQEHLKKDFQQLRKTDSRISLFTDSFKHLKPNQQNRSIVDECRADSSDYVFFITGDTSRTYYTYDLSGNLTEEKIYDWENDAWVGSYAYFYKYENNLKVAESYQSWDFDKEDWQPSSNIIFTYDGDKLISELYQTYQDENWISYHRNLYNYEDGRVVSGVYQNLDSDSNWYDSEKIKYSYNEDHLVKEEYSKWYEDSSKWIIDTRFVWSYGLDTATLVSNVIKEFHYWDVYAEMWIKSERWEEYFDQDGRLLNLTYSGTWDEISDTWAPTAYVDYIYNGSRLMLEVSKAWDDMYEEWYDFDETKYYYSCTPTAVNNVSKQQLSIYPNPSSGQFSLNTDLYQNGIVEIYSITGQRIISLIVPSLEQVQLDISSQPNGLYIVKVQSGKDIWIERVVKD